MRWRFVCVSILIAAGVTPRASGQEALETIDSCLRRLDPQTDIGYERIAARCPELARRLEASTWARWLPRDWKAADEDLSAGSLSELRTLLTRELAARPMGRTPELTPLPGILARLGPLGPQRTGTWSRFTHWLREALARDDQSASGGWLDRLTARVGPTQTTIELVCYACLAIVVVLALAAIVNELRVAGMLAVRRRKASGRTGYSGTTPSAWDTVQRAPMPERPRLLLELIARRLMELGRLPPPGGLTVRELLRTARFAHAGDGSLLAELALAAERVRYSAERVPEAALLAAVEDGRRLLERLQA